MPDALCFFSVTDTHTPSSAPVSRGGHRHGFNEKRGPGECCGLTPVAFSCGLTPVAFSEEYQSTIEEARIWWTEVRGDGLRSQIVTSR